jgi:hypothetical protein
VKPIDVSAITSSAAPMRVSLVESEAVEPIGRRYRGHRPTARALASTS